MRGLILESRDVSALFRLMFKMYKLGIVDADEACDPGLCMERLNIADEPGKFVRVNSDWVLSWKEWKHVVMGVCLREITGVSSTGLLAGFMDNYFKGMKKFGANYWSVAMVLFSEMYALGVKDYCEHPLDNDLKSFVLSDVNRWWPQKKYQSASAMTMKYIAGDILMRCKRRDMEIGGRWALAEHMYDIFLEVIEIVDCVYKLKSTTDKKRKYKQRRRSRF